MLAEVWAHAMHGGRRPPTRACWRTGWKRLLLALAWPATAPPLRPAASLAVSELVRRLLLALAPTGALTKWPPSCIASAATLRRQLARERAAFSDILRSAGWARR